VRKNGEEIFLTPHLSDASDTPDLPHPKSFPDVEADGDAASEAGGIAL